MTKIVLFINRLIIGGPTNQVFDLYKHLKSTHQVFVIYGKPNNNEVIDPRLRGIRNPDFIEINALGGSLNPFRFVKSYFVVKKILKTIRPDIVHTHTAVPGFLGRIAANNLGVPLIIHTFHGFIFKNYFNKALSFFYRLIERYLLSITNKVIVLSHSQKTDLMQILMLKDDRKIAIISLGLNIPQDEYLLTQNRKLFREKYIINDDTVVFGMIGRISPIKNHKLFIDGLAFLKAKKIPFKAFIVGDGKDRNLLQERAKALKMKISDESHATNECDIIFTSWCTNLSLLLPGLDVVVLTSKSEGTPYALLEAQAYSKPVIATDVGGVKDIVVPNKTGILIPSEQLDALLISMEYLITNSAKRMVYEKNAVDFIRQNFSLQQMIEKTSLIYFETQE